MSEMYGYDAESYEAGYRDGMQRREEQVERLLIQLECLQQRYGYLLKHVADMRIYEPPAPIVISRDDLGFSQSR